MLTAGARRADRRSPGGGATPAPRRPPTRLTPLAAVSTARRARNSGGAATGRCLLLAVDPGGADAWRLDAVVALLRAGGVGILPTDSHPAFVCDPADRDAVRRLYEIKGLAAGKRLALLCRGLADVSRFTLGFPPSARAGEPDFYRAARTLLPGPYTLILHASKELPKQVTNFASGRAKTRAEVGVRVPDDAVAAAVLDAFGGPLLCSTARAEGDGGGESEAARLADAYGPRGLAFVVDAGPRACEPSTVVDLTSGRPRLVRAGRGDTAPLEAAYGDLDG